MSSFESHVKDFVASGGGKQVLRKIVPRVEKGLDRAVSYGRSGLKLFGGARMLGTGVTSLVGSAGLDPTAYKEAKEGVGEIKKAGGQLAKMYKKDEPAAVRKIRLGVERGIKKTGRRIGGSVRRLLKSQRRLGSRPDADRRGTTRRGMDPDQLARITQSLKS